MTLHFLCPAPRQPAGGVEKIYQFVAALERAGMQAMVVHPDGSKPLAYWFEPAATVVRADQLDFDVDADVLVVPERWAFDVRLPNDAQVIVLNQGAYLTFGRLPLPAAGTSLSSLSPGPFGHDGLLGVVCVSTDSERYLRFTFPELDVRRIHVGIDTSVFSPGDMWRDHALAYMPRRRPDEVGELLRILAARGRSPDWVLRPLEGLDHRGVADALRAAPVFLNFPIREGFPLPPLEAMACGCIVIGYSGRGGDEYLLPDCSFPVPEGDSIEYARVVETVIDEYTKKDERLAAISRAAIDLVSTEYTMDRQDREAVEVFTQLAPTPRAATGASTKVPMASMLRDVHAHDPSRARVLAYHAREGLRTLTRRAHG